MPLFRKHHGGRPGFGLPDAYRMPSSDREHELDAATAARLGEEMSHIRAKAGWVLSRRTSQKRRGLAPVEIAKEHLELSRKLLSVYDELSKLEDDIQKYKAGTRKGSLMGSMKTAKDFVKEVAKLLVFSQKEGYSNRGVDPLTKGELRDWVQIMSSDDRASMLALRLLAEQSADQLIDTAKDLMQEQVRFEARKHTLAEGWETVKLDLIAARRRVRMLPKQDPDRMQLEEALKKLHDQSKKAKKPVKAKLKKLKPLLEKVGVLADIMFESRRALRRIAAYTALVLSGIEMLLAASNLLKMPELEFAGGAGVLAATGLLGFDAIQEGSDARRDVEEGRKRREATAEIDAKIVKIEAGTFVDRGKQRGPIWPFNRIR